MICSLCNSSNYSDVFIVLNLVQHVNSWLKINGKKFAVLCTIRWHNTRVLSSDSQRKEGVASFPGESVSWTIKEKEWDTVGDFSCLKSVVWIPLSAWTLLIWQQEGHLVCNAPVRPDEPVVASKRKASLTNTHISSMYVCRARCIHNQRNKLIPTNNKNKYIMQNTHF